MIAATKKQLEKIRKNQGKDEIGVDSSATDLSDSEDENNNMSNVEHHEHIKRNENH